MNTEYDTEPVPGLPAPLPPGERMLWQGRPDWKSLARRGLHVNKLAAYFGVLLVWRGVVQVHDGVAPLDAVLSTLGFVPWAACALGLVLLFAWGSARSTMYTVTDRRIVMRFGIALPMALNIPFRLVGSAGLKVHADGSGDIPLALTEGNRIAWLLLWPHARPWRVSRPEPMLRAIPEASRVAGILADALTSATAGVPAANTAAALPAPLPTVARRRKAQRVGALGSAST
ncbi:PH domain-containing protein [Skermanella mucosa]|uniref:photosynthetic complex putative assembly protein PuhB n=1 Tax=Skermanella mucosa TaxID=1789672 RepID=UPI00192A7C13|nr:photosynthetic complex putative assembly protein PuhB [Skermanella mucosa]UEM22863.1 PH domain-containing protein [Skermanella mucosa]